MLAEVKCDAGIKEQKAAARVMDECSAVLMNESVSCVCNYRSELSRLSSVENTI